MNMDETEHPPVAFADRPSFFLRQLGVAGDLPLPASRPWVADLMASQDLKRSTDKKIVEQLERLASSLPALRELARPNDLLGPVTLYRLGHARLFDPRTNKALTKPTDNLHVRKLLHTGVLGLGYPRFRELETKLTIGYAGWIQIYTTLRVFDATDGFKLVPRPLNEVLKPRNFEQRVTPEQP